MSPKITVNPESKIDKLIIILLKSRILMGKRSMCGLIMCT